MYLYYEREQIGCFCPLSLGRAMLIGQFTGALLIAKVGMFLTLNTQNFAE